MRWLVFTLILIWALPSHAQNLDSSKLESLTKAEENARKKEAELTKKRTVIQSEIDDLKKRLVKTASEVKNFEIENLNLKSKLKKMDLEESTLREKIYGDRQALITLVAALQRIENNPPPALAIRPEHAAEAARAEKIMTSLSHELKSRADELSGHLKTSQSLRSEIQTKQKSLNANETSLAKRHKKIAKLVNEKSKLEQSITEEKEEASRQVAKLASEAKTLRELIESFEAASAAVTPRIKPGSPPLKSKDNLTLKPVKLPKGIVAFSKAKGKLQSPVSSGHIIRNYGGSEKGITIKSQAQAQVVAPYAGRIEFAGAFKNYDNVVIINVGDGYFILLTGLEESYVESGENINMGEPVGLLPFKENRSANLYIEFRKSGATIDPKPWLGAALASDG